MLSPTQAEEFQIARGCTPVAQMTFASQVEHQSKGEGFHSQAILIQANSGRSFLI
jgi:hypothetical protein